MQMVAYQMEYNFMKEKMSFMEKFCLIEKTYENNDLLELIYYVNLLMDRLSSYAEKMNKKHKITTFDPKKYEDYFEYMWGNLLLPNYQVYQVFLKRAKEEIDFAMEKSNEEDVDINEVTHNLIDAIHGCFVQADSSTSHFTMLDMEKTIDIINNYDYVTKGILFIGENCNDTLDTFLFQSQLKDYYLIEFDEDIKSNLDAIEMLVNDLKNEMRTKVICILKNIDLVLNNSNNKLQEELTKLFTNTLTDSSIKVIVTSNEYLYNDLIKNLYSSYIEVDDYGCRHDIRC